MAKLRGPQSEFEQFMGECLRSEDPIVARYVAQHEALLERVTVLERALETIADPEWASGYPPDVFKETKRLARKALDG